MRQPNPATWTLWAVLAILNGINYLVLTQSITQSLQVLGASALNTLVAVIALFKGKYQPLSKKDALPALLAITAGIAWWLSGQAAHASYLLGAAFVAGILPTFRSVSEKPNSEPWLPWALFTIAYGCSLTSVIISSGISVSAYIYFVGFLAHGALLSWIFVQSQRPSLK